MQKFKYSVINHEGKPESGAISAVNETSAITLLRNRGYVITDVSEQKDLDPLRFLEEMKGVSGEEMVMFTRQLATMLSAGLPINQALKILAAQTRSSVLQKALTDIGLEIDGGASLSMALSKHKNIFPRLYISLIRAGEVSGSLDTILHRLADSLEKDHEFKSKTKGALIYPIIIILVMFGVMGIMFVFVIPKLSELYKQLNVELPFTTRILIGIGNFSASYWWLNLGILALLYFAYRQFASSLKGRYMVDDIKFKLPIFGNISKESQLTSFIRTLGVLMSAGIPILDALDVAADTLGNIRLKEGALSMIQRVEKGQPLAQPLRESPYFPSIMAEMIAIGEQTGKMDEILIKLSEYFEGRVENATRNLSTALEPIIMVSLGVIIGFLVISLILPIYSLTSKF